MTTESTSADDATRRDGSRLSEGLGPNAQDLTSDIAWLWTHCRALGMARRSDSRLMRDDVALFVADLHDALRKANEQAEHFERLWYLTNEDAARYAFAKTLEGQVVTMETFKVRGAAELDQALDDAMMEAADAQNEAGYGA